MPLPDPEPPAVTTPPATLLPVNFEIPPMTAAEASAAATAGGKGYPRDPFFDGPPGSAAAPGITPPAAADPFGFFDLEPAEPLAPPPQRGAALASPTSTSPGSPAGIIPMRNAQGGRTRSLESFATRSLVIGLIRLLQKRGVLGEDELQRFLVNLIESGQYKEEKDT